MPAKRIELVHGDCMDGLCGLEDGCAKLILTDPPYGIGYRDDAGRTVANDERPYIWWLNEAHRVTQDKGGMLCWCRWDVQEAFRLAIELAGFTVRSQIIWAKRGGGQGDTRTQASPTHEVAWWATKGRFRWAGKRLESVIEARSPHAKTRTHPTEKPVRMLREIICSATHGGELVVDPFMGTGSTGVAARQAGRRFWGCELDAGYVETARTRLAATTPARGPA